MKITFGYTTAKRGADLTGTLQFMSLRILKAIDENQAQPSQGIADDIESFIYVLGYAVLMKITRQTKWDTSKRKYWQDTFDAAFGKIDHKDIVKARVSIAPLEWAQKAGTDFELEEIGMSRPFFNILLRLFILLQDVHRTQVRGNIGKNPYVDDTVRSEVSSQPEIMLGYREFREILEQGITKLELRE
ncbi:hypothetical protein GLOTRDRAFT_133544 [Gloeophyllum trabeum ATCC 11539]|nr:uncharacterized protein GLOTRDRAFT_133544 [Gloeophyllum trabeum ATCC 11539]EPQ50796.1 hypothetical protein GLOTRDRAFT_133544 [Gloeophyllum trabeum ATCC 11539]